MYIILLVLVSENIHEVQSLDLDKCKQMQTICAENLHVERDELSRRTVRGLSFATPTCM